MRTPHTGRSLFGQNRKISKAVPETLPDALELLVADPVVRAELLNVGGQRVKTRGRKRRKQMVLDVSIETAAKSPPSSREAEVLARLDLELHSLALAVS